MTMQADLWDVATEQYGFVTTRGARNLGVPPVELAKLANRNQLRHVTHGVYRFDQLPETDKDEYMLAVLWTGADDAVLSHETVLSAYELCDVNPDQIHITIPKAKRIRRDGGEGYVIHHTDLVEADKGWWEGIPSVRPGTAIEQCIAYGTPTYLLADAIKNARRRGTISEFEAAKLRRNLKQRG
ncbi:type IV toxin-antitoxin system AbiEi family antitoxin domain-containing protein [Leifsonia naganoensis]|uniref:Putative transcriptional regulator of viral defense system n=1 Tax=Leifsonia naganoensis TaxID=150025 RepID=A0A853DIP2_9MICO|nr:type IV toxin-antitoxin system AbiEi family antitoxin domain-containing protein [Leifsonia naganoensis]NYK09042.1 putative transcriptional regulator of viral defense system [Leifsonia naganoensis]